MRIPVKLSVDYTQRSGRRTCASCTPRVAWGGAGRGAAIYPASSAAERREGPATAALWPDMENFSRPLSPSVGGVARKPMSSKLMAKLGMQAMELAPLTAEEETARAADFSSSSSSDESSSSSSDESSSSSR